MKNRNKILKEINRYNKSYYINFGEKLFRIH